MRLFGLAASGIMTAPSFVKIRLVVLELKHETDGKTQSAVGLHTAICGTPYSNKYKIGSNFAPLKFKTVLPFIEFIYLYYYYYYYYYHHHIIIIGCATL
jgi:hypothetical protein